MHGANQIFGPASETYAGFAWDRLAALSLAKIYGVFDVNMLKIN